MEKLEKRGNVFGRIMQNELSMLVVALIGLMVVFSILTEVFFTPLNLLNVLRQVSYNAIAAIGMAMIIISGEIDLSVGSLQALAGVLAVMALNATGNVVVAVVVALAISIAAGVANGVLVTVLGLNSFIATLATMAIWRGMIMIITNAVSQIISVPDFSKIGTASVAGIPIPIIIMVVLVVVFHFVLNNSAFGRYIYAVGGNRESAKLAGLNVKKIKMLVYILGNLLFGVSAVILTARLDSGQPNAGEGMEMNVVAATVLGGVSMTGGTGTLLGAIVGVVILGVIQNGLVLLNVNSFWQDVVRGIVIILAVYLDVRRKISVEKRLLRESQQAQQA
ncbi:ABC transporter permease [Christensenellaceae bacterium OttesenSCG-928-K19]|nr:ABC transporter permease [Christensenellaceae bacterium OttesenSCG-928-K19]